MIYWKRMEQRLQWNEKTMFLYTNYQITGFTKLDQWYPWSMIDIPTWTFQFGCQTVPLNGCQFTIPIGFKDGTPTGRCWCTLQMWPVTDTVTHTPALQVSNTLQTLSTGSELAQAAGGEALVFGRSLFAFAVRWRCFGEDSTGKIPWSIP